MQIYFSSFVLLSVCGLVSLQEISHEYVPEVVYPKRSNRMRDRILTSSSREQKDKAVQSDHHDLLQKRLQYIKENRRNRDQFIVIAPVEGHRVYTKDRYFVSPRAGQTADSQGTQFSTVRVDSEKLGKPHVKEVKQQSSVQKDKFLTLITVVPPLSSSRAQHSNVQRNLKDNLHNITQGVRVSGQTKKIAVLPGNVRFPAEPWQIPPNVNSKYQLRALQKSNFESKVQTGDLFLYREIRLRSLQQVRRLDRQNFCLKLKRVDHHTSSSYEDYSASSRHNFDSINSIEAIVPTNKIDRPVSTLNPNQKLDFCCRKQGLSPTCQTMCNFDTFSDKSLVNAFLTNQCPGPQLGQAFDCATTKADHSECCIRKNVHIFNNGQCLPFCRTHIPTPPNAFEYLACLQVFESIKGCYREYQLSHPNLFGD
ncbi:hypothetical protein QR680_001394 [Steinernema hermaphroditum]|uniref:Domain of unknown function DB domain-containing protein n=1 Tax=Steinernema hermaphroditum TaxID=289476 RepID=A0AA39GY57_9BILA|nr:hypothetical protein QR680_001394 [Steinernema hermaphroditum]